jgi:hypothetical protein
MADCVIPSVDQKTIVPYYGTTRQSHYVVTGTHLVLDGEKRGQVRAGGKHVNRYARTAPKAGYGKATGITLGIGIRGTSRKKHRKRETGNRRNNPSSHPYTSTK